MLDGDDTLSSGSVPSPFAPPVKRSITIAGHQTAISLEPIFWEALKRAAREDGMPLNALVARIDVARIAMADAPNLTSAIRCWLMSRSIDKNHSH